MTRIIVEGPDGAGKTNLIRRLRDRNPLATLAARACTSDNGPLDTVRQYVDNDLSMAELTDLDYPLIYDRHPLLSEPIYGPLIRGYIDPGMSDYDWLSMAMARFMKLDPWIIFCLPPYAIVNENIQRTHKAATEHQRGVLSHAMGIYDSYVVLAARQSIRPKSLVWNYTEPGNIEDILELVEDH